MFFKNPQNQKLYLIRKIFLRTSASTDVNPDKVFCKGGSFVLPPRH